MAHEIQTLSIISNEFRIRNLIFRTAGGQARDVTKLRRNIVRMIRIFRTRPLGYVREGLHVVYPVRDQRTDGCRGISVRCHDQLSVVSF